MKQLFTIIWVLCSVLTFAQNTLSGTITDKETQQPLPFVNITDPNSSFGATADAEGKFSISPLQKTDTLIFSFVGYAPKKVAIAGITKIDIELSSISNQLDELVITALGIKRDKRNLGYAIQKLNAKEVNEVKAVNFLDNLSGKLAGVTVTQGASGVGSTSKIVIRGESSFTNNNPLFVVDGIIINNNAIINTANEAASGFQSIDFGNGAMDINPDDIEDISVLKGPSAAALYGTRASNGVIIINTKDGSKSQGLGISVSNSTFFETPFQLPRFQNKYGQGNSGQFEYVDGLGGGVNDAISYSYGPELDAGVFTPQYDSPVVLPDGTVVRGADIAVHGGQPITPTEFKSNPDNLKDFYQTGVTSTTNIALSSGFEKGSYRLSYTDMNSESIIPGVNLNRNTASARLVFEPTKKLKVSSSVNYVNTKSDNRPASGYGSENINYGLVAWGPRQLNIVGMKDYWQPGLEGTNHYSFNYTYFDNPYFTLLENQNGLNKDRLFANLSGTYEFTDKWSLTIRSGMDYSNELRTLKRAFSSNRFKTGAYAENSVYFSEYNTDFLLNRRDQFGDFTTNISIGGNRLDQYSKFNQTQANTLAQPGVFQLSNASSPLEIYTREAQKRINSVYGIAKIGYKNFLFLDITGRNDWSSALATANNSNNASFFYPSVSSSLVLSEVLELPGIVSYAQLRASYAQVGNDTDPYQNSTAYIAQTPYLSEPTLSEQNFIANANLVPERTSSFEVGADVRVLNDRVRLDVTYYDATTTNQIIALPVAASSGYDLKVVNGSAVRSRGIEAILGANVLKKGNFNWDAQVNFSRNISTVSDLPNGIDKLTLGYSRVYDNANQTVYVQVEEGGRIGDLYGTGYKKTEDGKFIVDENGNFIADNNLKKLGNYNPDFIIGLNNQLSYKKFTCSFLIDWRQGGILVSRTQALAGVAGQLEETEYRPDEGIVVDGVINVGTEETPIYQENDKAISAESYYRSYYDRNHEENNTFDASYVKLRSFSIGYNFSTTNSSIKWLQSLRSVNLSLIGRNIFAISDLKHFDPEQLSLQGNQFVSGVEDMSYPTVRSIGLKLSINL